MSRQTKTTKRRGTAKAATAGGHPGAGIVVELRKAIAQAERNGMSRYAIAKAAGLPYSQVYNVAEGTIPRLDSAERIATALGLRIYLN